MHDAARISFLLFSVFILLSIVSILYHSIEMFVVFCAMSMSGIVIKIIINQKKFQKNPDTNIVDVIDDFRFVSKAKKNSFERNILSEITKVPVISIILKIMENDIREKSGPAGITLDEKKIIQEWGIFVILGIVILPIVSAIFFVLAGNYVFFTLCAGIPAIVFFPKIYLGILASDRRDVVEKDMLFFLPFVEILNHSGRTIIATFDFVVKSEMFEGITKEILLFKRRRNIGIPNLSSLELMVRGHPSEMFSEFIGKYVSFAKTDNDELKSYLSESIKDTYSRFDDRIAKHAAKMGGLFLIFSTSSAIGPIMITTLLLFPGVTIPSGLLLVIINIVPAIFMITGMVMVPPIKIENKVTFPIPRLVVFFGVTAIVVFVILQDILLAILSGVAVSTLICSLVTHVQISNISKMEKEIPHVIRTMITKKEKGIDLIKIIREIPADRGLSQPTQESFRILGEKISAKIKATHGIYDSPSGMMKTVNFVMHSIISSGGGDRLSLESFSDMISKITRGHNQFQESVKGSLLFLFATPVIILFATSMITLINGNNLDVGTVNGTSITVDTTGIINGLKYTIVPYSLCIGITISKGIYSNIRVLWPTAVSTGIGAIIVGFWDVLYELITDTLT